MFISVSRLAFVIIPVFRIVNTLISSFLQHKQTNRQTDNKYLCVHFCVQISFGNHSCVQDSKHTHIKFPKMKKNIQIIFWAILSWKNFIIQDIYWYFLLDIILIMTTRKLFFIYLTYKCTIHTQVPILCSSFKQQDMFVEDIIPRIVTKLSKHKMPQRRDM